MTRAGDLSLAAAVLLGLVALSALLLPSGLSAQGGSCRSMCWESYGACYKATNNRQRCQASLQRCLNGCIRRKR